MTAGRVVVDRGGRVESEHRFTWSVGEGDSHVYLRSAAKPLQALPAVRAGVAERVGLDEEILDACGLNGDDLACGAIPPRDPRVALDSPPRRIHHNCSGKHALGLALCVAEGWPTEGYLEASHPLQRAMAGAIGDVREDIFSKGPGYLLYKIVDDCVDASFPMLAKMGNKLERIEEDIFEGKGEDVVRDISNVKQEIINFRKVVRPQRAAFRDLERNKARYIAEDLDIYFEDIIDASERVWDLLENYKEVVEGLEATNESAIAHRTNETFRILTAISIVFLPLTLIASIFGMNVKVPGEGYKEVVEALEATNESAIAHRTNETFRILTTISLIFLPLTLIASIWGMNVRVPGEQSLTAFWIIMVVMLAILVAVVGFFRRRGWL